MTAAPDFPSSLQWSINHYPSDRAIQALRNELMAYNIVTAAMDASQDMAVFLHDTHGQLRGGIVGRIWGQYVEITYLWVHPSLRGHGYGSRLLQTLEQEGAGTWYKRGSPYNPLTAATGSGADGLQCPLRCRFRQQRKTGLRRHALQTTPRDICSGAGVTSAHESRTWLSQATPREGFDTCASRSSRIILR